MYVMCCQLKLQAEESESTRRRLERARNDVVRQVTAIVAEKDSLEREVELDVLWQKSKRPHKVTPRSLQARIFPKPFKIQQVCRFSNKSIGWGQGFLKHQ